jgi:hypothetical protein
MKKYESNLFSLTTAKHFTKQRAKLWQILTKKGCSVHLIETIKSMYTCSKIQTDMIKEENTV